MPECFGLDRPSPGLLRTGAAVNLSGSDMLLPIPALIQRRPLHCPYLEAPFEVRHCLRWLALFALPDQGSFDSPFEVGARFPLLLPFDVARSLSSAFLVCRTRLNVCLLLEYVYQGVDRRFHRIALGCCVLQRAG